ncbi:MAG: 2-dehydropantoate 2-reductase [Chloroflexota bacterium]|jgi:2-dehydropantoate 2-reductase
MKIAVVGTGGVGGYFGGLLARAGEDVTFFARGTHLEAIRRGLQVKSVHGDFAVSPAKGTDNLATIGPVDLALVCVKDFQLEGVLPALPVILGPETVVLPLLNGVRAGAKLAEVLGREQTMGGLCRVVSFVDEPGVIRQLSPFRSITFGEWDGRRSERAQRILKAMTAAEIDATLADDIEKEMWTKFVFITAYSGVGAVTRSPAGDLLACPETMAMLRAVVEEIVATGRAKGVALDEDIVEKTMAFFEGLPDDATASMQRDVQDGCFFELEALTGSLVRNGQLLEVPTPVNQYIYATLKPQLRALERR